VLRGDDPDRVPGDACLPTERDLRTRRVGDIVGAVLEYSFPHALKSFRTRSGNAVVHSGKRRISSRAH
jgi:hypothetical protein